MFTWSSRQSYCTVYPTRQKRRDDAGPHKHQRPVITITKIEQSAITNPNFWKHRGDETEEAGSASSRSRIEQKIMLSIKNMSERTDKKEDGKKNQIPN